MTEKQRQALKLIRTKPYSVTSTGQVKIPAVWLALQPDPTAVLMYETEDGDLLVSSREYKDG